MSEKTVSSWVVQCTSCKDWFEPKLFSISDVAKMQAATWQNTFQFQNATPVVCPICNEKVVVYQENLKAI